MKKFVIGTLVLFLVLRASAQEEAIVQEGEIGLSVGASQYFGDLNPNPRFNTPNLAASAFFRKNLGGYVAIRVAASYAFLAYSDKLNGYNEFMYHRNLSFNTNIWEGSVQGDFNFFKYTPAANITALPPTSPSASAYLIIIPILIIRVKRFISAPSG